MPQEPVLEPSAASVPGARCHHQEREDEYQQSEGLGQKRDEPVGTGEEEQSQQCQQQVDLTKSYRAAVLLAVVLRASIGLSSWSCSLLLPLRLAGRYFAL